jgi:glycosyltransferase involved in cell wall biosynthesis
LKIVAFRHGRVIPPTYGALIRSWKILSHFAERGNEVSLFYYGDIDHAYNAAGIHCVEIRKVFPSSGSIGHAMYQGLEGKWAFELISSLAPRIASAAREYVKNGDVVYVEHIWSCFFPLIYAQIYGKPVILDDHNVETILATRAMREARGIVQTFLALMWSIYVHLLEAIVCGLATMVIVTSETDRSLLKRIVGIPSHKIRVVENVVDLAEFRPDRRAGEQVRRRLGIPENATVLLFLGMLDYPPNLHAARWIVENLRPKVLAKNPSTWILLVGRNPPRELAGEHVITTGEVESAGPYVNASDVCLAPFSLGSGTRMKILSYLACGKPVVATSTGAEGYPLVDKKEILLGKLENTAELIYQILEDEHLRDRVISNGKIFVKQYDWDSVLKKVERILTEVAESRKNTSA